MIKIFDNIIPKKKQEELKNLLLGNNFPWYFVADITHLGNKTQSRPGHSHLFYELGKSNSHLSNEVNIISDKVNKKIKKNLSPEQVRSFLQLPLNEKLLYKDSKHREDTPHIDIYQPHTVFLYYVNDSDGDTVIYENLFEGYDKVPHISELKELKRVTPKAGRVVLFNGKHWHTSYQPEHNVRCVINYNII
mgnify:CR=1 FL=1